MLLHYETALQHDTFLPDYDCQILDTVQFEFRTFMSYKLMHLCQDGAKICSRLIHIVESWSVVMPLVC
jgi:hypothetical protein